MAELNDVVKRARIACSLCGFEKTSNDDNDDTSDKFGCGGCAATKIWTNEDITHIRETHKSHSFYTSCHVCSATEHEAC